MECRILGGRLAVLLVMTVLIISGCTNGRVVSSVYSSIYMIDHSFDHEVFVRQYTQDSANVYFTIFTDQLLTKRSGPTSDFQVETLFELVAIPEFGIMEDSLFYRFSKRYGSSPAEQIKGSFRIPLLDTTSYELHIRMIDGNSKKAEEKILFLSSSRNDPRYITSYLQGVPSEFCACNQGEEVFVEIYEWDAGEVEVSFYDVETELAPPPFSISSSSVPKSSLLSSERVTHDGIMAITCPGKGALEFHDEEGDRKVRVPVFRSAFPALVDRDEMMAVLKYITTSGEYKDMRQSENARKAFEFFWLECGGSRERARVLIDNFYSRVEEANLHFSGLVEGWKTDRGLIHLIYGPPEQILRLRDSETWYYGTERTDNTLRMTFDRNRDFSLDRSLDYRQSWYLTVDSWRSGRTISQ